MKKTLCAVVVLFALSAVGLFANRPVSANELPANIQKFIKSHFPSVEVSYAKQDDDWLEKHYTVVLTNGDKLEFTNKGEWLEIDCEHNRVPEALIPAAIREHVAQTQYGHHVIEFKKERRHYEVRLNNKVEMEFSFDGRFLRFD